MVKALGIEWVHRDGRLISRWRVAARNLIAWLPFLLLPFGVRLMTPALGVTGGTSLLVALGALLALTSALLPDRGLADRLVGAWPVPR